MWEFERDCHDLHIFSTALVVFDVPDITFTITVSGDDTVVTSDSDAPFRARLAGGDITDATDRKATLR